MKTRYIIGILLILTTSCSDFLKESSQDLAYVRSYVDLDETLLGDGYMNVASAASLGSDNYSEFYYPYIHFMADETQENVGTGRSTVLSSRDAIFGYYTWQRRVGINVEGTFRASENADWDKIYKHINIANMVINTIDNQTAKTSFDRNEIQRIKGEAYFLRAAYYFTLVNLYGKPYSLKTSSTDPGVPLKLTDYVEDLKFSRNTVAEVYEQVVKDLKNAEICLENIPLKSVYRAGIVATYLLQSRGFFFMKKYKIGKKYDKKVFVRKCWLIYLYIFFNMEHSFLSSKSEETIFSMGTSITQQTVNGLMEDFGISDDLYAQYRPYLGNEDLRRSYFMEDYLGYQRYTKVKPGRTGRIDVSDNFLFRTAEAYLNLAEAAACSGDESTARTALNALRLKRMAHIGYISVELSGSELVTFIRDERRRELCLEGHRWFDLRRYMVNEKYPFVKTIRNSYTIFQDDDWGDKEPVETRVFELKENDDAYTLPIPIEVLNFNDGMKDNERAERPVINVITY